MTAPCMTLVLYGKGGVGKSTTATHLAVAFAQAGHRVLLVGCDPKADTSLRLLGGPPPVTVLDAAAGRTTPGLDPLILPTRSGVDVLETGGPEPGLGCGGRGVALVCQMIDEFSARLDRYDVVLYDVLGDLVCGGFVAPLRSGRPCEVYIVSSEEGASLFAANNIARALGHPYHASATPGGIIFNLRHNDAPRELLAGFADRVGLDVAAMMPREPLVLEAELEGRTVLEHAPDSAAAQRYRELGRELERRHAAGVRRTPTPLGRDEFWACVRGLGRAMLAR